jgi:hypothetical protein
VIGLARHDCFAVPTQLILSTFAIMLDNAMLDMAHWFGMLFGSGDLG